MTFKVGDRVRHKVYGDGKIIEIKTNNSKWPIVIRFERKDVVESFSEPFLTLLPKK